MLREAWNTKLYMSGSSAPTRKRQQPFLLEESSRETVAKLNELMGSDYAWDSISLISHIACEADRLGVWAEGCPCKEHAIIGKRQKQPRRRQVKSMPAGAATCPLKCCRAPELATGQAMDMQSASLDRRVLEFTETISMSAPQKRVDLQGAFSKALGRLWGSSSDHNQTSFFLFCCSYHCFLCECTVVPFSLNTVFLVGHSWGGVVLITQIFMIPITAWLGADADPSSIGGSVTIRRWYMQTSPMRTIEPEARPLATITMVALSGSQLVSDTHSRASL